VNGDRTVHGGPDALGVPAWDFSTNANACGPCPEAVGYLQRADAGRYPDPGYGALREQLAAWHGVAPARIVPATSASEFIFRITAVAVRTGMRQVLLPRHAYSDYRQAALAWGLPTACRDAGTPTAAGVPALVWACEPSSPLGIDDPPQGRGQPEASLQVLDRAYEPLRLDGAPSRDSRGLDAVWQLHSPNKALGLTGVRAAYAIAPAAACEAAAHAARLAPSWVLGAHGVALLQAWCDPQVQAWLQASKTRLRAWKRQQLALLRELGCAVRPGRANFMACRPPGELPPLLARLRGEGIKLRDCASFGLPGWVRLSVQPPEAQAVLRGAWEATA
jgi:histidinol-phosphate aminotransferase